MGSPENRHASSIIQRSSCVYVFWNIYVYTYMWVTTINDKRGYGFERKQRGVYERDGREDREERNDVIV